MSQEQPQKPDTLKPTEVFGLTKGEQAACRVDQERFLAILDDDATTIHEIYESENSYGEFLFVTVSRPALQKRVLVTFYGMGHHDLREAWFTDQWFWYRANPFPDLLQKKLTRQEAEQLIAQRAAAIAPYVNREKPSERARLFAFLADLTDEDGAYAELQDLEDMGRWLFEE